jgi:DNA-binding NarL/FixJ family response regulator
VSVRCLIVDDNASFLAEARGLLEDHGFDVIGTASSGDVALKHVAEQRLDLALIDVDLGEESGIDVAHRILDTTSGLAPKIILISARDESEYGDLIETSAAVGFLAKKDLTAAAIRSLLAGSDSEARPS